VSRHSKDVLRRRQAGKGMMKASNAMSGKPFEFTSASSSITEEREVKAEDYLPQKKCRVIQLILKQKDKTIFH
jgi:hypothetical protein